MREWGGEKMTRLSIMYKKQQELAMMREKCAEIYITETKIVSLSSLARVIKKRGIKKWG